jgi:hypothetical protein
MKEVVDGNQPGTTSTRKEVQCTYRLLNLLFSNDFAEEFPQIRNSPSRHTLDVGKAAYEEGFWSKVAKAYVVRHPVYDQLHFLDDDIFAFETTINPSKIVHHDWKKLRSLWKAVNADYKVTLDRYTQSGTHEDNFYKFCSGKKEAYYLRLHLANKPGLNEMVEASLPDACNLSSSTCSSCSSSTTKQESKDTYKEKKSDRLTVWRRPFKTI